MLVRIPDKTSPAKTVLLRWQIVICELCLLTIRKSRFAIVAKRDLMDLSCPEHGRDQDATSRSGLGAKSRDETSHRRTLLGSIGQNLATPDELEGRILSRGANLSRAKAFHHVLPED